MNGTASAPLAPASLLALAPSTTRVPARVEVPREIVTGRYTSSLGLRVLGWFAPELADRALSSIQSFVERVCGPVGGQCRVVSR